MTIIIPKSLIQGIDREHLRLLDTTCNATERSAHFSLTTALIGCNTTRRHTPKPSVYSNAALEIPVAAVDVITRVREIEIQFSCFYSEYGVVSSVGWKPSDRKLVFSDEGNGNFMLSLNIFPDKRFVNPYKKDDFPVSVVPCVNACSLRCQWNQMTNSCPSGQMDVLPRPLRIREIL